MTTKEVLSKIQQLEISLLQPSTRQSKAELNQLIADEFIEFGMSGNIYNKPAIIDLLPNEKERAFNVEDFVIKKLSENIVLATYKITEKDSSSLRSSIWKKYNGNWQIIFHQGTRILGLS